MKLPNRIIIAALTAALALPLAASAAKADRKNKTQSASETFATLDKDSDGFVTEAEYLAVMKTSMGEEAAKKRFAELDKDKNGKLSKEEHAAGDTAKKKRRKKNQ